MKCFYHSSDLDGWCSGAIVKFKNPECQLIGIDYEDDFPWDKIQKDEDVWMVDFCLQPNEDMWKLKEACANLIWIDHHKTSLLWADTSGFAEATFGKRSLDYAGCELVCQHFHWIPEPTAVRLLGRYDVWDHKDPDVLPFQYGMRAVKKPPDDTSWWNKVFTDRKFIESIARDGQFIQIYQESAHKETCKMAGFDLTWEGLRWTVINGPYKGSNVHKSRFDVSKYDAMLGFYWTGKLWVFSLTTENQDIDVSEIAKKHGGGGHRNAAGFQAKKIPFRLGD